MEESAEELLKSRGITDLRDMIGDLNEKAFQTKEELQLMVGSKYHDFIQSADAISFMKDSAENVGKSTTVRPASAKSTMGCFNGSVASSA